VLGDFGLLFLQPESPGVASAHAPPTIPEMARNYRTPELVACHNAGTAPPAASDVFQLGLVVAELFTGSNPLVPDGVTNPVRVNPIREIAGPSATPIKALIEKMLIMNAAERPEAARLVGDWQGIYLDLLERTHAEQRAAGFTTRQKRHEQGGDPAGSESTPRP
jgi:serine/threonine protein kinase